MSNQLICDKCQKSIVPPEPYFTLLVTKVKGQIDDSGDPTGGAEVVEPTKAYDYHENHLPKILDNAPGN